MLTTRPKIAELVFQLYGRTLHPELFEVCRSKSIVRGNPDESGYQADIQITNAGHIVTWRHGRLILTEVATSSHQPLPKKRLLMSHRLDHEQTDTIACRGQVYYEVDFDLTIVTAEAITNYQREFEIAGLQNGLVHRFDSNGRVGLGAISYVHTEARDHCLSVKSLHTFPDDCAIVRCQSKFRLPE